MCLRVPEWFWATAPVFPYRCMRWVLKLARSCQRHDWSTGSVLSGICICLHYPHRLRNCCSRKWPCHLEYTEWKTGFIWAMSFCAENYQIIHSSAFSVKVTLSCFNITVNIMCSSVKKKGRQKGRRENMSGVDSYNYMKFYYIKQILLIAEIEINPLFYFIKHVILWKGMYARRIQRIIWTGNDVTPTLL